MDRREAIKKTVLLTGAALSVSTISAVLKGCQAEASTQTGWMPQFFNAEQAKTLSEIAETILPATETPGAKDVGVPEFIDQLAATCLPEEERMTLRDSIEQIEALAQSKYKKTFPALEPGERLALLNTIDAEARTVKTVQDDMGETAWDGFLKLKQLVLLGYFTSKKIGTEVTSFLPIPGQYKPCIPYEEGQPAWTY